MGRSLKFTSAQELETKINGYFDDCDLEYDRRVFKHDEVISEGKKRLCANCDRQERTKGCLWVSGDRKAKRPYTVSGLALYLGTTRQTLLEHQGEVADREKADPRFADTVTHAKQRIENYASERLFDPEAPTRGIMFSLSNNGDGWAEKRDQTIKVKQDGAAELAKKLMGA